MDVYPILHREKIYNIITALDLSFGEVRRMLDWLDARGAFTVTSEDEFIGAGKLFTCDLDGVILEVDVHGYEVVVYRRSA
jgi:hypothetical protein